MSGQVEELRDSASGQGKHLVVYSFNCFPFRFLIYLNIYSKTVLKSLALLSLTSWSCLDLWSERREFVSLKAATQTLKICRAKGEDLRSQEQKTGSWIWTSPSSELRPTGIFCGYTSGVIGTC